MKNIIIVLLIAFLNTVYAQKNLDTLSFNTVISNFNPDNALIVIGEAHEIAGTYETELFIIEKFLKRGHHTIIIEGGISEAYLLNHFFSTGDENILNFTKAHRDTYKKFILNLKSFNFGPINFVGVDFERAVCLEYLFSKWFGNTDTPAELLPYVKLLLKINSNTSDAKMKKILLDARKKYHLYESVLTEFLKDDVVYFKKIIFNPVFQADYSFSSQKRDAAITKNLLSVPADILHNSILIFGSNHFTNKNYFWSDFAQKNKNALNCLPFLFAYKNCNNFIKPEPYNSVKPLSEYLLNIPEQKAKVGFSLQRNIMISPFDKQNRFILVQMIGQ
jgi:hypothetical protein